MARLCADRDYEERRSLVCRITSKSGLETAFPCLTMTAIQLVVIVSAFASSAQTTEKTVSPPETIMKSSQRTIGLVVHGGAGTIDRSKMTPEDEREYRAGLENALRAGWELLQKGAPALDAVETAVRGLEDDSHFNAGRGSVF